MTVLLYTILLATIGIVWFLKQRSAYKKRIGNLKPLPGPRGIPFFGSLLQLGNVPNNAYTKWTREYGDIFEIKLASQSMVVVSDPKMAKEIFSNDPAFTGRTFDQVFAIYERANDDGLGIFLSQGERWEVHRRFLLRQLRDFGFGKSSMEALILDEVNEVIKRYREKEGEPIGDIRATLRLAMVNSLWTVLTSNRFDQDDPKLLHLTDITVKAIDNMLHDGTLVTLNIPFAKKLMPERSGYNKLRSVMEENKRFFTEALEEKKRNYKDGDANDFIDVYLAEVKKAENDPNSHFHGELAEQQLVATMSDLFSAGSDSTATSIAWSILYLCKFPEVQEKLQKEIGEITGNARQVSVSDRPNMPYTLALVDEILRFSSLTPDGVPHTALTDREFRGYFIPKGAMIQPNTYFIHNNPKIWGDPENFRPERFLSEDGKKFLKNENVQAFQIGRRQCAGETMARDTIFLYLTNLFQQFSMKFDPSMEKEPSLEPDIGFLWAPLPFSVLMTNRMNT